MKNSLKKLVVLLALTFVGRLAFAWYNTTTVGGIEWKWEYVNGEVYLYGDYDDWSCDSTPCINPDISGSITIPSEIEGRPVVGIESYAFDYCNEITSVTIPQSVISIGVGALSDCRKLLANCKRDDGVVIVDGCVVQVYGIYNGGKFLDDVVLPEGTRMIADGVFGMYYSCTLKSLSIPASLTIIGEGAFDNCTIGSISVDANNPNFCVVDGVLYDKAKTTVIHCSADKSGELVLPSTVKRIEKAAFANCKLLTSVVIPSGVTEIGESAFESCSGLVYVTLPKGLTDIDDYAFGYCSALESVTIPNGVKSIGARAFTGCNGLREVVFPESTTWIGPGAFERCKNLKFVQIAAPRAVLGYEAFYSCDRIEAIIMPWEVDQGSIDFDYDNWPDCFYWFGAGASKKTIAIVHACDEDSKYLNATTYNAKRQFIKLNIGTSAATVVDAVAVYDQNVVETDETNRWLAQSATTYDGGFAMRSAEIGDSQSSKARMRVVGPAEVSFYWKVSSEANYDWLTLSVDGAKSDQISGEKGWSRKTCTVPEGDHVVEWSYSKDGTQKSGSDCGWVDGVSVSPLGPRWVTHANADGTLTVVGLMDSPSGALNIPESISGKTVTAIGEQAFYKCDGLTAVTMPNSVTNIGAKAFAGCSLLGEGVVIASGCVLCVNGTCPESVELPAGTRLIADEAFASSAVKSLTLPSSLTHVGNNAFQYCTSLAAVHISDLAAWCRVKFASGTSNPLCYAHHLYLGNAEIEALNIPNTVTSVSDYAFYECDGLKTVTIPDTVVSLGEKAFYGCGGITELSLPNGATSYGAYLFYNCSELVSVTIPPSQTTFSTGMFSNCGKLKEIHISDLAAWCQSDFVNNPLTSAGHLYLGDNEIVDLVVPEGVDCIGNNAFCGCSGLKSVLLSESVTSIGMYAFASCTGVTALRIPSSVTSVADYALSGCQGVVEIEFENGVQTIGQYALSGDSALSKIFIPSTVTGIGKYAFNSCSKLLTVVVDRDDGERVKSLITSSMSSSYASRLNYVEAGLPHQVEFVIGEHGVRTGGGELIQTVAHGGAATAPTVQSDYGWKMSWDKAFGNITNDLLVSAVWTRERFEHRIGDVLWTTCVDDGDGVIIKGVREDYGVYVFNGSNLVIPSEIGGRAVTGIDGGALKCSSALVSITIPSSVMYMAEGALSDCVNLDLVKTETGDASRVRQMMDASGVDVSWVEFRERNGEGSPVPVKNEVALTITNVVVNYIVNSVQPSFVLPATYDTGFVNIIAEVKGGCVAVPATWTVNYPKFTEKFGSDFTKALAMKTGKKDGAGNPMFVWQDYVAGTDPTDETDVFTASITIVDGKVQVSYSPELDDARKALRKYTTWGKEKLTDKDWSVVGEGEEDNFNFFKVTVEMK